jgi:MGT family glycosyltransferase
MPHYGIICPPVSGHVDPLAALARTLISRGHRATFFHVSDLEHKIRSEGVDFCAIASDRYRSGLLAQTVRLLARLKGLASLRYAIECECRTAELILEYGPECITKAGVDALLVDQNAPAGASVAEHLNLPFASICTSLPLNREPSIPPPFVGWRYLDSTAGRLRNRLGYTVADRLIGPIHSVLNRWRRRWGLPALKAPDDSFSRTAQIAQMPRVFDFPRAKLPDTFHYVGPMFDGLGPAVRFPTEKLDGRPLVYGSLGTLQDSNHEYFQLMTRACSRLNVQLVISLGTPEKQQVLQLGSDVLVVGYAPQLDLLARAAAAITHGGMNTTQQALRFGVPLVAIPLTHDQPAIASRLSRCGAGIVIPPRSVSVDRLRGALSSLLTEGSTHRERAREMQVASERAGGVQQAAGIIERALQPRALTAWV